MTIEVIQPEIWKHTAYYTLNITVKRHFLDIWCHNSVNTYGNELKLSQVSYPIVPSPFAKFQRNSLCISYFFVVFTYSSEPAYQWVGGVSDLHFGSLLSHDAGENFFIFLIQYEGNRQSFTYLKGFSHIS